MISSPGGNPHPVFPFRAFQILRFRLEAQVLLIVLSGGFSPGEIKGTPERSLVSLHGLPPAAVRSRSSTGMRASGEASACSASADVTASGNATACMAARPAAMLKPAGMVLKASAEFLMTPVSAVLESFVTSPVIPVVSPVISIISVSVGVIVVARIIAVVVITRIIVIPAVATVTGTTDESDSK